MNKSSKIRRIGVLTVAVIWLALSAFAWFVPSKENSQSERRPLAQMPSLNASSVLSSKFMSEFESYTLDQFPFRDTFRQVKSLFLRYLLKQKDNNGIYIANGYAAKTEYPLSDSSIDYALEKFEYIYNSYLEESKGKIYSCVVPDKSYYLAKENGYLAMDYEKLFSLISNGMPYAKQIDITDTLSVESYYKTDTHWRQEYLLETAKKLSQEMEVEAPNPKDFSKTKVEDSFYGVYFGQAALPMQSEEMYIMESDLLKKCKVFNFENEKTTAVYDMEKLKAKDQYEIYLSGPVSLLTVTNEEATTDKELIIFRDSFSSSIAPLLMQGYKSITLVDIRYLSSLSVGKFIDFHGQDVLFMYSTLVLNNSSTLK